MSHASNRCRGFTLIETVIGIGLIVLITGGVFRIVLSVAEAANTIKSVQIRREMIATVVDSLRWTLRRAPAFATVRIGPAEPGDKALGLLIRDDATNPFAGADLPPGVAIVLRFEQLRGGTGELCRYLTLPAPEDVLIPPLDKTTRMVLLGDVAQFEWNSYDFERREWLAEPTPLNNRPSALRLALRTGDDSTVRNFIFGVAPSRLGAPPGTNPAPEEGPPPQRSGD